MKKFNINEYMYIQITQKGWQHLKKTVGEDYINTCIKSRELQINNEAWYRLQCHNVFDLFTINFGRQPMFGTNVMFDDSALT